MIPPPVSEVRDEASAKEFLRWCCTNIGLGFHPDTLFKDYIDADNKRLFTDLQSIKCDVMMAQAFAAMPSFDEVYSFCLTCDPFRRIDENAV